MKFEANESMDQSEEGNKSNGNNSAAESAAKGGAATNVPVGNTSSNVVDLTTTSSVFPSDNKLESQLQLSLAENWRHSANSRKQI